jgi:hypothetical protein
LHLLPRRLAHDVLGAVHLCKGPCQVGVGEELLAPFLGHTEHGYMLPLICPCATSRRLATWSNAGRWLPSCKESRADHRGAAQPCAPRQLSWRAGDARLHSPNSPRLAGDCGACHVLDMPAAENSADDLLVDVIADTRCAQGRTRQELAARLDYTANLCRITWPVAGFEVVEAPAV